MLKYSTDIHVVVPSMFERQTIVAISWRGLLKVKIRNTDLTLDSHEVNEEASGHFKSPKPLIRVWLSRECLFK